jgi:hypothetical protein
MTVDGSTLVKLVSAALTAGAFTSGGCARGQLSQSRTFDVTVPVAARSAELEGEDPLPSSYRAQRASEDESERSCCKGMNDCKGKGGCAVESQHECAGKNECKGLGGCNAHCPH